MDYVACVGSLALPLDGIVDVSSFLSEGLLDVAATVSIGDLWLFEACVLPYGSGVREYKA